MKLCEHKDYETEVWWDDGYILYATQTCHDCSYKHDVQLTYKDKQ